MVRGSLRPSLGGALVFLCVGAALAGRAEAGPADPRRDCFGEWQPLVTDGRCEDGDPRCDSSQGPGCRISTRFCTNQTANPAYGGRCSAAPIERVGIFTPSRSGADRQARAALIASAAALGGAASLDGISFSPPLDESACGATAALDVPLRRRGPTAILGKRSCTSITVTPRGRDIDRIVLTCLPPVGSPAAPLGTGCTADLDATACAAADGDYGQHGFLPVSFCLCRTEDAGAPCTRARHCQGLCLATTPQDAQGSCSEHVQEFGCFLVVDFRPFEPPAQVCFD